MENAPGDETPSFQGPRSVMSSDCSHYGTIDNINQCYDDVRLRKLNDFKHAISDIGITQHDEEDHAPLLVHG